MQWQPRRLLAWLGIGGALVVVAVALVWRSTSKTRTPSGTAELPSISPAVSVSRESADLSAEIDRAAHYLASQCDAQGRFVYRTHLDQRVKLEPAYNLLRHAGAVYALAQYCRRTPDSQVKSALLRAAGYLRQQCLAPVGGNPRLLAVWSSPETVGGGTPRQAKTGGAGLALAALAGVEQVQSGFTPLEELRALGRFLVFMQKEDGTFYSKYFPDTGRSDRWKSMYYPGEATLGLLLLCQQDDTRYWLTPATRALQALAREAAGRPRTLPDQWFLLATRQWLDLRDRAPMPAPAEPILAHARRICLDMLAAQKPQTGHSQIDGCYTPNGLSCPTATNLEGLLAAYAFLPPTDRQLRPEIRDSIHRGMHFLRRCQVESGPHAGAFPRTIVGFHQRGTDTKSKTEAMRAGEIRIDYVQHALSAMLEYETQFGPS